MADRNAQLLEKGCQQLGIPLDSVTSERIAAYLDLLVHWNRRINLTAIRDRRQMVIRHVLDSIAVMPYLPDGAGVDVGTGAGLPGLIIAMLDPDRPMTLLDGNGKKTRFLFHVVATLGLENVAIVQSRVEDYSPVAPFSFVISRAFAELSEMTLGCQHLVSDGAMLAMKGAAVAQEVSHLDTTRFAVKCHKLEVPYLAEARHLVEVSPVGRESKP